MTKDRDYVQREIYGTHLAGGKFSHNPQITEKELTRRMYTRMLTELACNRFKWEGLPEEIDARFLEVVLCESALAVFFHSSSLPPKKVQGETFDPYNKYFALRGSPNGALDMYDNAMAFQVTGNMMLNAQLDVKNCVPIWANYLRYPDHDIIWTYSNRLAELDASIAIAAMNMRNTNFVAVNENSRLSAQNMIAQRDKGEPVIYTVKGALDPETLVTVIDMKVHPDTLPKLMVAKSKMWNECMTLLGINNANQDKAERLVADEVSANDEQIDSVRQIALNARQQACEQINAMFGLSVSVDFHQKETEVMSELGGDSNGELHSDTASGD